MRGTAIRKPILGAVLVGAVLIVGFLLWYLVGLRPGQGILVPGERTNVLLIGCAQGEEDRPASELALMSWSGDEGVVFLIVPDALTVKREDGGLDGLGVIYAREGADGARKAVSDLLGVEIRSVVAWSDVEFIHLVETLEGLPIEVGSDVVYAPASVAGSEVEIRAGEQTLGGPEALAYLRGESTESRAARQQVFLRALLARGFFERDEGSIRATVRSVYPNLETDLSLASLCEIGTALGAVDPDSLRAPVVPAKTVSVDGLTVLQPRAVETERLVATLIRGLELLTPSEVRVAVFNGNGVRLMASRAAEYLRARGFEVTRIANAESFDYPATYVVVLTDEAKAWVLRDALPGEVKIVYPDGFEDHYEALVGLVPFGTDLLLIAGAGMEVE